MEPFVPHQQEDEFYVAIASDRDGETLLFCRTAAWTSADVDAKASRLKCGLDNTPSIQELELFVQDAPVSRKQLATFYAALLKCYRDLHFTLLEINPLVVDDTSVTPLDLAARSTKRPISYVKASGGRPIYPRRSVGPSSPRRLTSIIRCETGASLKLTILNVTGRVWTLVADGGASMRPMRYDM